MDRVGLSFPRKHTQEFCVRSEGVLLWNIEEWKHTVTELFRDTWGRCHTLFSLFAGIPPKHKNKHTLFCLRSIIICFLKTISPSPKIPQIYLVFCPKRKTHIGTDFRIVYFGGNINLISAEPCWRFIIIIITSVIIFLLSKLLRIFPHLNFQWHFS